MRIKSWKSKTNIKHANFRALNTYEWYWWYYHYIGSIDSFAENVVFEFWLLKCSSFVSMYYNMNYRPICTVLIIYQLYNINSTLYTGLGFIIYWIKRIAEVKKDFFANQPIFLLGGRRGKVRHTFFFMLYKDKTNFCISFLISIVCRNCLLSIRTGYSFNLAHSSSNIRGIQ